MKGPARNPGGVCREFAQQTPLAPTAGLRGMPLLAYGAQGNWYARSVVTYLSRDRRCPARL